jgi:hypothetical protein
MAFACTKFKAYVVNAQSPTRARKLQRVAMTVTGLNTDVALDIGTLGGTFWTAAKADGTYGPIATAAYDTIAKIVAEALALDEIGGTIEGYDRNDGQKYDYFKYSSTAYGGGSATPAVTVTGLLSTDTVMSVCQHVPNANSLPLLGWSTVADNALTLAYSADPGANGTVEVVVRRTASNAGASYAMSISGKLPIFTFVSGGAPTTNYIELQWELADNKNGFFTDYGN